MRRNRGGWCGRMDVLVRRGVAGVAYLGGCSDEEYRAYVRRGEERLKGQHQVDSIARITGRTRHPVLQALQQRTIPFRLTVSGILKPRSQLLGIRRSLHSGAGPSARVTNSTTSCLHRRPTRQPCRHTSPTSHEQTSGVTPQQVLPFC